MYVPPAIAWYFWLGMMENLKFLVYCGGTVDLGFGVSSDRIIKMLGFCKKKGVSHVDKNFYGQFR